MLNKEEIQKVRKLPLNEVIEVWDKLEKIGKKKNNIDGAVRFLCQNDLAYLLSRS
jgi:hypothetical protein